MARKANDFDLGFGHLGNGLAVWNRRKYEMTVLFSNGDAIYREVKRAS